jgi:hypothetical protein
MNVDCVYGLIKLRKQDVEYRNVHLSIDTYKKLDKYLLELIQKRGDRHISLDEAVKSLIDAYYLSKTKKKR